ncbi:hypothetical protein HZA40_00170 [Candidatus Peregrinibacteria bacterium]|nr:hypothetical protein [Candidatus Peregrinibacteria bacterium]
MTVEEGPGNLVELFPAPSPVAYESGERAGLDDSQKRALLMRGLLEQPERTTPLPLRDPRRSRRVEGREVVISLGKIEKEALRALEQKV